MTDFEPVDWKARLAASVAASEAARAERALERQRLLNARQRGLQRRHAAKLARLDQQSDTIESMNALTRAHRNRHAATQKEIDQYQSGASIKTVAAANNRAYSTMRLRLVAAGVQLRPWGRYRQALKP